MLDEAKAADEQLAAESRAAAGVHSIFALAKTLGAQFEEEPAWPPKPHYVADLYVAHHLQERSVPAASSPALAVVPEVGTEDDGADYDDEPGDTDVIALAAWVAQANALAERSNA